MKMEEIKEFCDRAIGICKKEKLDDGRIAIQSIKSLAEAAEQQDKRLANVEKRLAKKGAKK